MKDVDESEKSLTDKMGDFYNLMVYTATKWLVYYFLIYIRFAICRFRLLLARPAGGYTPRFARTLWLIRLASLGLLGCTKMWFVTSSGLDGSEFEVAASNGLSGRIEVAASNGLDSRIEVAASNGLSGRIEVAALNDLKSLSKL